MNLKRLVSYFLCAAAFLAGCNPCLASTVTGTLLDNQGLPYVGSFQVSPKSNPGVVGTGTIVGKSFTTNTASDGTFSFYLVTGSYALRIDKLYEIDFPVPAGTGTNDISVLGTNLIVFAYTNSGMLSQSRILATDTTPDYLGKKIVAGTNIVLTTNNPSGNATLQINSTASGGGTTNVVTSTNNGLMSTAQLAQLNAALSANQTITVTGDAAGSGSTAIALTLPNVATPGTSTKVTYNAKGLVTSGTTLSSGDIPNLDASKITTGTISANNLPTNLVTTNDSRALNFSGPVRVQQVIFGGLPVWQNIDPLVSGGDGTAIFQAINSASSGAGIGCTFSGTNYSAGATPMIDRRTGLTSVNSDGSTNYVYDLEATQFFFVPRNAPYGDRPGQALWVFNSHPFSISINNAGIGNQGYLQSDGTNGFVDCPLWQNSINALNSWDAGYQAALHVNLFSGSVNVFSNLVIGGQITAGGTWGITKKIAARTYLDGTALYPGDAVQFTGVTSTASSHSGGPLAYEAFGNGSGLGYDRTWFIMSIQMAGNNMMMWPDASHTQFAAGTFVDPATTGTVSLGETNLNYKQVCATTFASPLHTPASSAETNYVGAVCWDASFLYVWTATNVNKRAALSTW